MIPNAVFRGSQGQDKFAYQILGQPPYGTFLDIGCNNPFIDNNSIFFEEIGWDGYCIDNAWCDYSSRKSTFVLADATTLDYKTLDLPPVIDYVSIDVDECSTQALVQFLRSGYTARVITIEHDAYRFDDELRMPQRLLLRQAGYSLLYGNVCFSVRRQDGTVQLNAFEDWWVSPQENLAWEKVMEVFTDSGSVLQNTSGQSAFLL